MWLCCAEPLLDVFEDVETKNVDLIITVLGRMSNSKRVELCMAYENTALILEKPNNDTGFSASSSVLIPHASTHLDLLRKCILGILVCSRAKKSSKVSSNC